jgi:Uma2 family endonuclease
VTRVTAAEFLALPETNQIQELIDGEVIVAPPKAIHQQVVGNIHFYLRLLRLGGSVWIAPTGLIFDEINIFEPDVFWVGPENDRCVLREDGCWHGAPDLVVEVASASTARRDRVQKFQTYEKYGVSEYWIIDPDVPHLEQWELSGAEYAYRGSWTPGTQFVSPVFRQTIDTAELLNGR